MVGIAQLVEHLVVVQDVAGSNPVTHPRWARTDQVRASACRSVLASACLRDSDTRPGRRFRSP